MEHFQIFYFLSSLSVGLIAIGAMAMIYLKTRAEVVLYYLGFHAALTLLIGVTLCLEYITIAVPGRIDLFSGSIPAIIAYGQEFIFGHLVLLALLIFLHVLFLVERPLFKSLLWAGGLIGLSIVYNLLIFTTQNYTLHMISYLINSLLGSVVAIYGLLLGICSYKTIQDAVRKKIARSFLLLLGMLLPVTLLEAVLENFWSSASFIPLIHLGLSVILPAQFVKYYLLPEHVATRIAPPAQDVESISDMLFQPSANPGQVSSESVDPDILTQYDISAREKDVIALILQGKGNAEIGETLCISLSTVKTHISNIYTKFGIKSRYELITLLKKDISSSRSQPS